MTFLRRLWPVILGLVLTVANLAPLFTPTGSRSNEWRAMEGRLEIIRNQTFVNEEIALDGKNFLDCKFIGVSFAYRGLSPFLLTHSTIDSLGQPIHFRIASGPAFDGANIFVGVLQDVCRSDGNFKCGGVFPFVIEKLK